jgi:hypothetical protein
LFVGIAKIVTAVPDAVEAVVIVDDLKTPDVVWTLLVVKSLGTVVFPTNKELYISAVPLTDKAFVPKVAPLRAKEVPVAAPKTGVTNVGVLDKTTLPAVPVEVVVPVPPYKTPTVTPFHVALVIDPAHESVLVDHEALVGIR